MRPSPPLRSATGDATIDALLGGLLQLGELTPPGRLHSAYLEGSYADGSASRLSDLDVTLVFRGQLTTDEHERLAVAAYRRWIGDEWAALLEQIQHYCRRTWSYALPSAEPDRAILRELCPDGLALENHVLLRYRDYLLAELCQPDAAARLFALRRLGQLIDDEPAVVAALRACASADDEPLRQAAAETLRCYTA